MYIQDQYLQFMYNKICKSQLSAYVQYSLYIIMSNCKYAVLLLAFMKIYVDISSQIVL